MRFRGLSKKGSDDELADISFDELDDPSRTSKFGGLDSSWTTDLILNQMCSDLKGKNRLTMKKVCGPQKSLPNAHVFKPSQNSSN